MLLSWVERGEVSRRNANHFYSLIQSANGHVRRLMAEKVQQEEELEHAKGMFQSTLTVILTQCKNPSVCLGARVGRIRVGGAIVNRARVGRATSGLEPV